MDYAAALCGLITKEPAARVFYTNIAIYHIYTEWYDWTTHVDKYADDQLSFACLASIPLNAQGLAGFFLMLSTQLAVKNE